MDLRRRTAIPQDEKTEPIAVNAGQKIKRLALKIRGKFDYTPRFLIFLIPCLFVALTFGGKFLAAVILLGFFSAYMFATLNIPWGSFISMWFSLVISEVWMILNAVFLVRHSAFYIFLILNILLILALTGMLLTLQFRFIQEIVPAAKLFERALFSAYLYPTSILLTWAVITISGVQNAAYYLFAFLSVGYYCFGIPTKSCFRLKSQEISDPFDPDVIVCGSVDNFLQTISVMFLPAAFYFAIYHRIIFDWFHVSNFVALLCLGMLVVGILTDKHSLWWTGLSTNGQKILGGFFTHISIGILIICLEYRVIFTSFKHFINLPSPFSYIFVGAALYALYGALAMHVLLGPERIKKFSLTSKLLSHSLAFFGALCSAYVLGLPWYMYFSPIVGSQALMGFYFKQRLVDWIVFVSSVMFGLAWFMKTNFMFIYYPFFIPFYGFVSMTEMSVILMMAFFFSLVLPGFVIINRFPILNTFFLIAHSNLVFLLEWVLHKNGFDMYPSYLVVFTSILGLYVFYRGYTMERISYTASLISCAIYFAKLSLPISYAPASIIGLFLLVLSLSELLLFYPKLYMHPIRLLVHALILVTGAFLSEEVQKDFLRYIGTLDFLYLNTILITLFLSFLPLTFRYFQASEHASLIGIISQKINVFLLGITALASIFGIDILDFIYSGGNSILFTYVMFWELLALCSVVIACIAGILPVGRSAPARLIACILIGLFCGLLLPNFAIPSEISNIPFIYYIAFPLIIISFLIILTFIGIPSPMIGHAVIGVLYLVIIALYPVVYFSESEIAGFSREEVVNFHVTLSGIYILITVLISVVVKASVGEEPVANKGTIWLLYIGNLSALISVILSGMVSISFFGNPSSSLPFILPFLLLLQQDNYIFRWLTPPRRFFPVILSFFVVFDVLVASAIYEISRTISYDAVQLATEGVALIFVFIPQYPILSGAYSFPIIPSALPIILTIPFSIISLIITKILPMRILAGAALFIGMLLWLTSERKRRLAKE